MRTLLLITVSLTFAATCVGQQNKPTPSVDHSVSPSGPPPANSVTVDVPATSYRTVGQAQVSYFAETDSTEVRIELSPYRSQGQSANMFFVFSVKGKHVVAPQVVSVGLVFFTDKGKAENLNSSTVELDGQSLSLNDMTSDGVGYDYNAKSAFRHMEATIPFALFEKLVNDRSVTVHVADVIFGFGKKDRDGLRDMLKAINRPKAGS
jgi:hypothetical protein